MAYHVNRCPKLIQSTILLYDSDIMINQRILLGVSGGISAYKCAELTRLLREAGAEVRIVMTHAAKNFITPLTLQALSGFPVRDSLWDEEAEKAMSHIELAKWADLILISPATADCIAKLAHGLADDLLTTLCLASTAPLAIAPAMNQVMWHHAATQSNIQILKTRNVIFLGPESGEQACGDIGLGRMQEPETIVASLKHYFNALSSLSTLNDIPILITAGPTQEPIDPVRYISNHSSGKMGYALAEAASRAGAKVTLISGPTHLDCPKDVTRINVKSAQEMHDAVMTHLHDIKIFIGAAAVADYRAVCIQSNKIKKHLNQEKLTLELVKNPDILAQVAALKKRPFVVGFAAETDNLIEYATQKRINKKLDMIVANYVNAEQNASGGFYSDNNSGWILTEKESIELALTSKIHMAEKIWKVIARLL